MAFTTPFDPDTPTDASPVADGDNEIRSVKAGVIERMNTIVEDFEDGTDVDGEIVLKLKDSVFPIIPKVFYSGTLAARPNPPETDDLLYFAEDTDQLFYSKPGEDEDTFEWGEAKKADEQIEIASLAISAGEARFILNETDTRATRVKNAINTAKLSSSEVKVIYIPKTLWGYVADIDYDEGMYDPTILLVREGSMVSWYDPVAYGADVTGTANSKPAIEACYAHALITEVGTQMVAFTVPGTYLMTTDTDQRDVALFMGAGASIIGGGELTGDRPFRIPADDAPAIDAAFNYNPAGGGAKATVVVVAKRLHIRVIASTTNGTGQLTVDLADAGFGGAYDAAKIITLVASERGAAAGNVQAARVSVAGQVITLDLDGGAQTAAWDLFLTFSP